MISVFQHTLAAWRASCLWMAFGTLLAGYIVLFSPLAQMARAALPKTLPAELAAPAGWVGMAGFVLLFPLLLAAFAARLGSRMIAGEIEGGTLGLLLAQPVTRRAVLFGKLLAMLAVLTMLTAIIGAGMLLANLVLQTGLPLQHLPTALIGLELYALLAGLISLAVGSWSGSSRLSFGLCCILLLLWLGGVLLPYLPAAWSGWPYFSPLFALAAQNPFTAGILPGSLAILAGLALAAFLLAWWVFERCDLEV